MGKKIVGPTIPRWQLGRELKRLRVAAGLKAEDARDALSCSLPKIHKTEAGMQSIGLGDLEKLLNIYGLPEGPERDQLLELRQLGKQRGWWVDVTNLGRMSPAQLLGFEEAAEEISAYEPSFVHGLLQTEDYATTLHRLLSPELSESDIEQRVQLRMARQERILEDPDRRFRFILGEAILRRPTDRPEVMNEQLQRLRDEADSHQIQIIPFSAGFHPGMRGAFEIFQFDEEIHSPVVYVECPAGDIFIEKREEVALCVRDFEHMTALALSPAESKKLIEKAIGGYEPKRR